MQTQDEMTVILNRAKRLRAEETRRLFSSMYNFIKKQIKALVS